MNRIIKKSNELWEADIKYGYINGKSKFFFVLSVIDVFGRSIVDYYMGYSCIGSDAASLLRCCLIKRNLFDNAHKPVIRTDNGPQFISHAFEDTCKVYIFIMKEYQVEHQIKMLILNLFTGYFWMNA